MQAAKRRARHQRVHADRKPSGVLDVESVDILGRIDGGDHPRGVDLARQRKLHQNPVDRIVGVESADQVEQLRFRNRIGQMVGEALHPGSLRRLALRPDIDGAGRVLADQDGGKAGCSADRLTEAGGGLCDRFAKLRRGRFSVDDSRGHVVV